LYAHFFRAWHADGPRRFEQPRLIEDALQHRGGGERQQIVRLDCRAVVQQKEKIQVPGRDEQRPALETTREVAQERERRYRIPGGIRVATEVAVARRVSDESVVVTQAPDSRARASQRSRDPEAGVVHVEHDNVGPVIDSGETVGLVGKQTLPKSGIAHHGGQ
jgi:hypothetical protein